MILGGKRAKVERELIDGIVNAVNANTGSVDLLSQKLSLLLASQEETNRLLRALVGANENFVGVIENFFALRKKIDIEESRRREQRELDLKKSPADDRF